MQLKTTLHRWTVPNLLPGRKKNCCRSTRRRILSWILPLLFSFLQCFAWCFCKQGVPCLLTCLPDQRRKAESDHSPTSTCSCHRYLWRVATAAGCRLGACQGQTKVQPWAAEFLPALGEGCWGWTWNSLAEKTFCPSSYMIHLLCVLSVESILLIMLNTSQAS